MEIVRCILVFWVTTRTKSDISFTGCKQCQQFNWRPALRSCRSTFDIALYWISSRQTVWLAQVHICKWGVTFPLYRNMIGIVFEFECQMRGKFSVLGGQTWCYSILLPCFLHSTGRRSSNITEIFILVQKNSANGTQGKPGDDSGTPGPLLQRWVQTLGHKLTHSCTLLLHTHTPALSEHSHNDTLPGKYFYVQYEVWKQNNVLFLLRWNGCSLWRYWYHMKLDILNESNATKHVHATLVRKEVK